MNAPALPAYLQNRQSHGITERATSGMGGVLPPHISRAGNSFTLIDAAGMKQPVGPTMDACVVDICDVMQKLYYEEEWKAGSDQPPDCYSRNGIAPSRDSAKPQSPTCAACDWNVRGSDTSKISGKPVKACRDQKEVALLLPQYPTMLFQLVIPPGSFKNWSAFIEPFKKGSVDVSDVLVRFGFQPQKSGEMTFQATAYIDENTFAAREAALTSKATDALVGRNDVPIAITHQPSQTVAVTSQPQAGAAQQPAQFGGQPQAQVPFGASPAQPASNAGAFGQTTSQSAQVAETRSPSEQPRTRKRRTQAEIAADNAAKAAAQAGGAPSPQASAPVQREAPFPVQNQSGPGFGAAPAAQQGGFGGAPANTQFGTGAQPQSNQPSPAGNGASFGIQQGADPNVDPQLAEMLRSIEPTGQ